MESDRIVEVRVARRYDASPERVFDAWLDPAQAGRFLFATENGTMVTSEIDPRVGGAFTFVDRRDGTDVTHEGEYLAIERPSRLVFEFGVDGGIRTRVTIDIVPIDDGCELTLVHEMPAEFAEYAEKARTGWAAILGGLVGVLRSK